jgi:hypothetical protein
MTKKKSFMRKIRLIKLQGLAIIEKVKKEKITFETPKCENDNFKTIKNSIMKILL